MVTVPLLIVKVNWARTAAGNASNSSSGSSLAAQPVLKSRAIVFSQMILTIELDVFMFLSLRFVFSGWCPITDRKLLLDAPLLHCCYVTQFL
jgi:hypothetical protein